MPLPGEVELDQQDSGVGEAVGQEGPRRVARGQSGAVGGLQPLEPPAPGGDQELRLAAEVVVDRRGRDAGPPGDVGDGRALEPELHAGRDGGGEEALPGSHAGVVHPRWPSDPEGLQPGCVSHARPPGPPWVARLTSVH